MDDSTNRAQQQIDQDRRVRHYWMMNEIVNQQQQRQQQQVSPRTSSSSSQQSFIPSQNKMTGGNLRSDNNQFTSLDTPCRQIAQLKLKHEEKSKPPAAKPSTKLLGSKSLSQLMPKNFNLFSKRPKATSPNSKKMKALAQKMDKPMTNKATGKLSSSRSFPNGSSTATTSYYKPSQLVDEIMEFTNELALQNCASTNNDLSFSEQIAREPVVNRIDSASLIGFPRQSTSNSLNYHSDAMVSATSISPITIKSSDGSFQNRMMQNVVASTPTIQVKPLKVIGEDSSESSTDQKPGATTDNNEQAMQDGQRIKPKSSKYKPFKNTALVLRDVKNSIGLRMKAKQDCQAFEKLTNEISTPPTKLYSPFNIYTPGGENGDAMSDIKQAARAKSKKRLNLNKNNNANKSITTPKRQAYDCSPDESANNESSIDDETTTPKGRIALQHKKHLLNANKFSFDSPTGRLRETVKDVEQFQQCIEDIFKAIRARGGDQASI